MYPSTCPAGVIHFLSSEKESYFSSPISAGLFFLVAVYLRVYWSIKYGDRLIGLGMQFDPG